jgi:hypothetical protein
MKRWAKPKISVPNLFNPAPHSREYHLGKQNAPCVTLALNFLSVYLAATVASDRLQSYAPIRALIAVNSPPLPL